MAKLFAICNLKPMNTPLINTHDEQFLRRFRTKERVLRLSKEEVAMLQREADQGDAFAQYGYGRWLYFKNPHEGAIGEAETLFDRTRDALPDSLAAYSQMMRYGETSLTRPSDMDVEGSKLLLRQAVECGSTYAAQTDARKRIFGIYCEAEPAQVAVEIEQRIATERDSDPMWLCLLAFAYTEMDRQDDAIRCYEQALDRGEQDAYFFLATTYLQRGNMALYEEYMEEGIRQDCALCMFYQADMSEEDFNALDEAEQVRIHQAIDKRLHRGLELGDGTCAYYLWYHHYYGELGFPEDLEKAFDYLEAGIRLADTTCIKEMVTEVRAGCLPPSRTLSSMEIGELALKAARYRPDDEEALSELRRVDDPAFLVRHKEEMERYWMPLFEKLPEEELDDDDGRFDAWT
ncbi:MAG: hypothetical protein IJR02_02240 [Bacteroidaceae bacterium]|nr:hypothetical protein [Bacteroidaceae bacterium]